MGSTMSEGPKRARKPDTICQRTGCWAIAHWIPVLMLPPIGYAGPEAKAVLSLPTCESCRRTLSVDDILSEAGKAQVREGFRRMGKCDPDFARARLVWDRAPGAATMN